jgi:hypothetical protein
MFERTRRGLLAVWATLLAIGGGCLGDRPAAGTPITDGGYTTVPLEDWAAVTEHCRRFADGGSVTVADERIDLSMGSAHVTVGRDGTVATGMALHSFELDAVERLHFDHEAGYLQVRGPNGLAYEFRRP